MATCVFFFFFFFFYPEQKELEKLRAQDQSEIKALKKELQRKVKALSEAAALLMLRKKWESHFGHKPAAVCYESNVHH